MFTAWDWDHVFLPALAALARGGDIYAYIYNPPWVLVPLIPFALLPYALGRVVLFVVSFIVFGLVARRLGAGPLGALAFLLTPLTISASILGNVEWLALAGLLLPAPAALVFLAIKPQVTAGAMLYLAAEAWRKSGARGAVLTAAPLCAACALSVVLYGAWWSRALSYLEFSHSAYNVSLYPYSIPLGLVLLAASLRLRRIELALAASPCFFPVVTPQCWLVALLALAPMPLEMASASAGLWLMVLLSNLGSLL